MAESLETLREKINEILATPMDEMFKEQIESLPTKLNEFGFDDFGFSPEWVKYALLPVAWFYKFYFRVEAHGLQNIPEGRVLLISNHSGQIPIDGLMIGTSLFLEGDPPRMCRSMIDRFVTSLPYVSTFLTRVGQILGAPENARALLEKEEALLVFPEGTRGINKLFWDRYKLVDFGPGFMRLALETNTPIVPVAVIGAEEQLPSFGNLRRLGKLFGVPTIPVMPQLIVPLLGWAPLPVKYRLYFGEPIRFKGDSNDEDSVIEKKVEKVRQQIQSMITFGLKSRKRVFW